MVQGWCGGCAKVSEALQEAAVVRSISYRAYVVRKLCACKCVAVVLRVAIIYKHCNCAGRFAEFVVVVLFFGVVVSVCR